MAREHKASDFQPNFGINWRPVLTREFVKDWDAERLAKYITLRKRVEADAISNPVGQGWSLPMWDLVQKNWKNYRTHVILGGNRCLRGDSLIYDPVLKISRRIDSISGPHHVYAWDGRNLVIAEAERPFAKPAGPMHRVRLSNGQEFVGASEHRVLLSCGTWKQLSHLRSGDALCRPESSSDSDRPNQFSGVLRLTGKASGFQGDYHPSLRSGDERLHPEGESGRDASPSRDDVPKRTLLWDSSLHSPVLCGSRSPKRTSDDPDNKFSHTHACPQFGHPSTPDALPPPVGLSVGTLSHASYRPCIEALPNSGNQAFWRDGQQSTVGSSPQFQSNGEFYPPDNQSNYESAYVESVDLAGIEVKWDMTVPAYANYWQSGVIHHNSSKSVLASRLAVWAAATIPEAKVRMYHVNEQRSVEDQQSMVYEALPQSIKSLPTKKGMHHSLQYSQKNGFTDAVCILPPIPGYRKGGEIIFGNYRQYQQDEKVAEGYKAHAIFGDEEMQQKLYETLLYRTIDYDGKIVLTFTTIAGWTPLVQDFLGKTKTLLSAPAPLLGGRVLPLMQESLSRKDTAIYYFWTENNPFIDSKSFLDTLSGRPKDEILARAYGIPTKSVTGVFPGFNKEINVIPHDKLPWLDANLKKDKNGKPIPYKVTRYMSIDPAGSKAWFLAWVAIDAAGTWWVYREYPDFDDWALPGNNSEGKPGPAQKGEKRGIKGYVELITGLEKEDNAEIYERVIDPRMGAAERQSEEGATTIISDLEEAGMTVIPAPGVDIENGIQLLKNLMSYDETKPIDSLNGPRIYISDRCQNIIYALGEYTAQGGQKEAVKDCVDVLRYLAVNDIQFIDVAKITDVQAYGRTGSY